MPARHRRSRACPCIQRVRLHPQNGHGRGRACARTGARNCPALPPLPVHRSSQAAGSTGVAHKNAVAMMGLPSIRGKYRWPPA
jgi:hypothetical protein